MKKLLIAANSQSFAEAVSECLSNRFDIIMCHTGQDALQLLRDFRPDFVAVDLMLSGIDGIGVLKAAKSLGIFPQVIAFSIYITDYVTAALEQLNVSFLIRLPCDHRQFAATVLDVAAWQAQEPSLNSELQNILAVLGFKINHAGCVATEACIRRYLMDPRQVLSTQLYPAVARELGGAPKQVEKAVSRAIEAAWGKRDEQVWRRYFPLGKNGMVAKPSNAQFLARIADCLSPWIEPEIESRIG